MSIFWLLKLSDTVGERLARYWTTGEQARRRDLSVAGPCDSLFMHWHLIVFPKVSLIYNDLLAFPYYRSSLRTIHPADFKSV